MDDVQLKCFTRIPFQRSLWKTSFIIMSKKKKAQFHLIQTLQGGIYSEVIESFKNELTFTPRKSFKNSLLHNVNVLILIFEPLKSFKNPLLHPVNVLKSYFCTTEMF